jgi:hypothetical protein
VTGPMTSAITALRYAFATICGAWPVAAALLAPPLIGIRQLKFPMAVIAFSMDAAHLVAFTAAGVLHHEIVDCMSVYVPAQPASGLDPCAGLGSLELAERIRLAHASQHALPVTGKPPAPPPRTPPRSCSRSAAVPPQAGSTQAGRRASRLSRHGPGAVTGTGTTRPDPARNPAAARSLWTRRRSSSCAPIAAGKNGSSPRQASRLRAGSSPARTASRSLRPT